MPVVYLDLDGTLLDVWPRYYAVMKSFFDRENKPFVSLDEYRRRKLLWVRDEAIVRQAIGGDPRLADGLLPNYFEWKRERLESEDMLRLDRPIGGLPDFAARLGPAYRLNLISVRRDPELAMSQLREWEMIAPFERIDFVRPSSAGNPKRDAIHDRVGPMDLMIGDSEVDIACGAMLGLRVFHVKTGLRSFAVATRHHAAVELRRYDDVIAHLST